MKLKLIATTIITTLAISVSAFAGINLNINGVNINTDVSPVIVNGRTLVPVRTIFENLGANVNWDSVTQTVTANSTTKNIVLKLNDGYAYVNGEPKNLDVPAQIINGRTMVPARFVAESLGANVQWNDSTQTVHINSETLNSNNTQNYTPNTNSTSNTNTNTPVKTDGIYVGSIDSDKYHNHSCRFAKKILSNNLIGFDSKEEAKRLGYSPCGVCRP